MVLKHWTNWIERVFGRSARNASRRESRRHIRPLLEALECRVVPAFVANFDPGSGVLTIVSQDGFDDPITIDDTNSNDIIDVNGNDVGGATLDGATTLITFNNVGGTGSEVVVVDPANDDAEFDSIPVEMFAGSSGDSFDTSSVSAASVNLVGGAGNDTLVGGGGDDILQGNAGNDFLDGNGGADQMFGGADSDTLVWNPGDGSDLMEGGGGEDVLTFNGSGGNNTFTLNQVGTRLEFLLAPTVDMDVAGVEQVNINALGGADTTIINDLSATEVRVVNVDLGTADGAIDTVTANGHTLSDDVNVSLVPGSIVDVAGLASTVRITNAEVADDTLTINGNQGDDTLKAEPGVEAAIGTTLVGGAGNDTLSADATLMGGDGNDTLIGGAGNDTLQGEAGDDTLVVHVNNLGGTDTFDGGTGTDVILVQGTVGNDTIAVTATTFSINGAGTTTAGAITDVETIRVEAGAGNDSVDLDGLTLDATVDAGDGNDLVDGEDVTDDNVQLTLIGGAGNDNLIGGDSPTGSALGDILLGGTGNDRLEGGRGQDFFFGGDGSDLLVWVAGDGSDLMEGGSGIDELNFIANAGANRLEVFGGGLFGATGNPAPQVFGPGTLENAARVLFALNSTGQDTAQVFLNLGSVETIDIDAEGGADQITVNNQTATTTAAGDPVQRGTDLSATPLSGVDINLGAGDGASDTVEINGTQVADTIHVSPSSSVAVNGLSYAVHISGEEPSDTLIVDGQGGNDALSAAPGTSDLITLQLIDATPPTVTVNQAATQTDPTTETSIEFTAVFSEPVTGFDASDVVIGGSAGATTATVTPVSTTEYTITVTGMAQQGTVTVEIAAGAAVDESGNASLTSTSTDNSVQFNVDTPTPTPLVKRFAVGADAGGSPLVEVYDADGNLLFGFLAYDPGFAGGVRVATGDFDGDGVEDIITGAGPGGGPHVRVFSGVDGTPITGFFAYSPDFAGGVFVAVGDIDNDGFLDIITGAGAGGGPHVRAFSGAGKGTLADFFAYSPAFFGGVTVAVGDIDNDGFGDIITGAGSGGSPHVRIFSGAGAGTLADFFAFDAGFTGGVFVASGDLNNDGFADLIVGAGAGGTSQVRAFDGGGAGLLADFLAFDNTFSGGTRVTSLDRNGDGNDEIIVGAGPGGSPNVRTFETDPFAQIDSFFALDGVFSGGLYVG